MTTKYNTGDQVMIPATIRSASQDDAGVVYEVEVEAWRVPEAYIQPDNRAIGTSMRAFAEAMPRRERV